jgi:pimeloyl-ACP methyl ester carboxylesterase
MKYKRAVLIAVLILALIALVSIWIAGGLLAAPVNQPIGSLPSDLPGEPVQFSSESGSQIHGWLIPGQKQHGSVMLMHGVRGNRTSMLDRARFLSRAGYTVLLFDFQAHGESPGQHITFGYLESRDARAAVSFLRSRAPGERIGVIGVSMGGAAALLATPPLAADALVLELVYPTIDQAIDDRLTVRFGKLGTALNAFAELATKTETGNQCRGPAANR